MACASGTISRARVQPPIARLWASSARSSDQSSKCSPGGCECLTFTCQCERVLKVGDLGTETGREGVIVMLPLEGFVSGRSRRASLAPSVSETVFGAQPRPLVITSSGPPDADAARCAAARSETMSARTLYIPVGMEEAIRAAESEEKRALEARQARVAKCAKVARIFWIVHTPLAAANRGVALPASRANSTEKKSLA